MKQLRTTLILAAMLALSSLIQAQAGSLFKISESGASASAEVLLCLNGKGPLSCQRYHVSSQNLAISTVIKHSYPDVGIKVLTSGYHPTGCAPYAKTGYCLFATGGGSPASIILKSASPSNHTVGGSVSGLAVSESVVLQNNGGDILTQSSNGSFTFTTMVAEGASYNVTVSSQPSTQTCAVSNGTGTMGASNVTNVTVSCSTNDYTVGGAVYGLLGTLVLEDNGGDSLTLNADGGFTFPTVLPSGSTYSVVVQSQPATQTCTINNGSGTITNANVTNVTVNCSTNTRTVGGSVSGLAVSESVVLQNNGGDDLTLSSNGVFAFATAIAQGSTYHVTVLTQPSTQTCTVTQGSGTAGGSNITNVTVTCATNTYTVGGSVSGLSGTVVLQNNGADNLSVSADGAFTFATSVAEGASYNVTISTQPATQTCTVTNGSGTMGGANVTNVGVSCVNNVTTLSASVSSLALSVTGRTEYGITPTTSGISRIITINNTGSDDARGFQVAYSGLPSGTTHTGGTCDALTTLTHGASCTIQINPGATATSNNSATSCINGGNGTAPVPGTVDVSAANASTVSTTVVVLDYGCIYQGGYVFAFDDTTSTSGSVGGKVMTTSDQAAAYPNGIVWTSNGGTGHSGGGSDFANVSSDPLPGISGTSTTSTSNPLYTTFSTFFSTSYNNPNPFTAASFSSCNGNSDGACNTGNILTFYNQFITNYVYPGSGRFTASAGPTPLTYYAAGLCKQTIATYSDWYLPAICEIGFDRTSAGSGCGIQANPTRQNIQSSLRGIAAFTVPAGIYWSSTEGSISPPSDAWSHDFAASGSSNQSNFPKFGRLGVRCVRAF